MIKYVGIVGEVELHDCSRLCLCAFYFILKINKWHRVVGTNFFLLKICSQLSRTVDVEQHTSAQYDMKHKMGSLRQC